MTTESKLAEALSQLAEIKARTQGRVYVHRYVTDDAEVARVFSDDIPLLVAGLEEAETAKHEAASEMLCRVRASLQTWPNGGCDIEIAKGVEGIIARSLPELVERERQAIARAEAAEGELARTLAVLAPNMPESGAEDAARQRMQALIAAMDNSDVAIKRLAQSEAEVARLLDALRAVKADREYQRLSGAPHFTSAPTESEWKHDSARKAWAKVDAALSATRPKGDDAVAAPVAPVLCRCCGVDRPEMLDCFCSIQTYKGAECCDTHQRVIGKAEGR